MNFQHAFSVRALAIVLIAPWGVARAASAPYAWENRLRGNAIVLLGEVHDNAHQHRRRLEVLKRAFAAGWRPTVAMEQFDREHQADIDQARRTRPLDADYLIDKAAPGHGTPGSGWNWRFYRPYVALALQYNLPLLAANLSRSDAEKIFSHGYSAVFDDQTVTSLGLDRTPEAVISAQKQEIDLGHCHAMPQLQLPDMARAQLARDAVMAATMREHDADGVVLLAGDGHVRRDIGVATWLDPPMAARTFAVGFLERGEQPPPPSAFDALVITKRASRPDPCKELLRSLKRPHA
jgi:uncharacterized iron-regulated protein